MNNKFTRGAAALTLLFSLAVSGCAQSLVPAAPPVSSVGARMEDGSIHAGVSPATGNPFYTTSAGAPGIYRFDDAIAYCDNLSAHGHKDWHVPNKEELKVLFNNRAAIGGFNETGSDPAGWYWSSSRSNYFNDGAWTQRFSDGHPYDVSRYHDLSLRCVR